MVKINILNDTLIQGRTGPAHLKSLGYDPTHTYVPDDKQQPAKVYLGTNTHCLWKSTGLMTPLLVIWSDAPGGKVLPIELWKLWFTLATD